jgi:hypothetical protein
MTWLVIRNNVPLVTFHLSFEEIFTMRPRNLFVLAVLALGLLAATSAQASYIDQVAAANPFLYYHFDETGVAHNSDAANSGTLGGTGKYYQCCGTGGSIADVTSPVSTGKQFNRDNFNSGSFVTASGYGAAYNSLSAFTLECLLKPNYDSDFQSIYASASWDEGDFHFNVNGTNTTTGTNSIGFSINSAGGVSGNVDTTTLIPTNTWAHVALTYANGTATVYINGKSAGSFTGSGVGVVDFNQEANVGYWGLQGSRYFDGSALDEFALYDSALSSETILSHAVAGGFASVPEPGTIVILLTGLLGLVCYAWRKRK